KKAYKNGEEISVAAAKDPVESLLATGFADMRTEDNRHNLPVFSNIIKKVRGIRRAGSAVHDLCMVAEGVFDGFWEYNLAPWDVAAGAVIIRCAGGKVTDMKGGENWLEGKRIVASNTHLHDNLLEWIQGAV
ncbi:MAG: inositol monophosphatase family protein, partial [bacterium]